MSQEPKRSVLFLCVANSARSQMAEGLARARFGDTIKVQSAGSNPHRVNPLAIKIMAEIGVDITNQTSKSVQTIHPDDIGVVVTLCAEEVCPVFLGKAKRLHWPLMDPDRKNEDLSEEQALNHFRVARDKIKENLEELERVWQV